MATMAQQIALIEKKPINSNDALVDHLWRTKSITSGIVKSVFLKVDRGKYAPRKPYEDTPQHLLHQATISAPFMHARAVELLLPYLLPMAEDDRSSEDAVKTVGVNGRPRRVLDIGSGSGFLVHVFAELVGDKSRVVGLDHLTELRNLGEANMRKFDEGVRFLESGRVQFHQGDGRDGWDAVDTMTGSDHGWDVIHVGAGAIRLHEELVRQLRCPGRLFIPLAEEERWSSVQYIWTVDKDENGCICKTKHSLAEFVWLMNAPTEPVVYSQEGDV